jgi:DnaJ-class molecular chaperone
MTDFYKLLGIARDADPAEITAAYRKLVAKYHPDRHQTNELHELAEDKLRALNEAYEVLSDPSMRSQYDAGQYQPHAPATNRANSAPVRFDFQRFLVWALFVIGTPLAVRFVRNPKVSMVIIVLAVVWFWTQIKRKR